MAQLWSRKALDTHIAHMPGVQRHLREHAVKTHTEASGKLAAARASTSHRDLKGATGPHYKVGIIHGEVDHYVYLEGPSPMSLEFGHYPSGLFAPEVHGSITKAPAGLFILTGSGGAFAPSSSGSSGRKRGKR